MKNNVKHWLMIGAALALQPVGACAQEASPTATVIALADAQSELAERLVALERQGASGFVAIARGDEQFFLPFGAADAASGRAYSLDTQFDVGSVTKPLTGLVASQLMAEGVLDPASTLSEFFDDVPADKAGITVEQLLTHSAGFSDGHGDDFRPMDRDEMLAEVFSKELLYAPGERYRYSNTGFSLIAAIIEKLTGEDFETIALRMFASVGMESTGYWNAYEEVRSDYDPERGPVSEASWGGLNPVSWALTGNGGMVSSARDLLGLGQALLSGDLPEEIAGRWKAPRISEGMDGMFYGYGLAVRQSPALGDILWHNGGNPAFRTEWWNIVDSNTSIVVHLNDGDEMIDQVLIATLESVTGLQLGRPDEGDEAVELGDLPEGEIGEVLAKFVAAIQSEEPAAWEAFVNEGIHPGLRNDIPMEAHLRVFGQLHREIAGGSLAGFARDGNVAWIGFDKDGSQVRVMVEFEPSAEGPRIVGVMSQ